MKFHKTAVVKSRGITLTYSTTKPKKKAAPSHTPGSLKAFAAKEQR